MDLGGAIVAGLRGRCPNCGRGPLFRGLTAVAPACSACGFDLRAADPGDGPVVFILLIVGGLGCFGLLFHEMAAHPPIWALLLLWPPLTALAAFLAIRPFKGVLVALQFHHGAREGRVDGGDVDAQ